MDENQFDDNNRESKEGSLLNDATFEHQNPSFDTPDDTTSSDEFDTTEMAPSEVEPSSGEAADTADAIAEGGDTDTPDEAHDEWVAPDPIDQASGSDESPTDSMSDNESSVADSDDTTENEIEPSTNSGDGSTIVSNDKTPVSDESTAVVPETSDDAAIAGTATVASTKKPWFKKPFVWAGVVAVVLVLLLGSSALAYKLWYQTPEKVLSDAVFHFVGAKSMTYTGTFAMTDGSTKVNIGLKGGTSGNAVALNLNAQIENGDAKYTIPANIVTNDNTLYVRVSNLASLEKQFLEPYVSAGLLTPADKAQFDTLVGDIDGTWYKLAPKDLGQASKDKKSQDCIAGVVDKIRHDGDTQSEITKIYQKHPLFTVSKELGVKDGSLGYELKPVSDKQAAEFINSFKQTDVYKDLVSCDSSVKNAFDTTDMTDESAEDSATIQIWVSRWSHQITKLTLHDTSDGNTVNLAFTPHVDAPYSVTLPKNTKSIDDLKNQLTTFGQSFVSSSQPATQNVEARVLDSDRT